MAETIKTIRAAEYFGMYTPVPDDAAAVSEIVADWRDGGRDS